MAVINLTIPDAQMPRVIQAITSTYGYQAILPNGQANPLTAGQFTKNQIIGMIKAEVLRYEQNAARVTADAGVTTVDVT